MSNFRITHRHDGLPMDRGQPRIPKIVWEAALKARDRALEQADRPVSTRDLEQATQQYACGDEVGSPAIYRIDQTHAGQQTPAVAKTQEKPREPINHSRRAVLRALGKSIVIAGCSSLGTLAGIEGAEVVDDLRRKKRLEQSLHSQLDASYKIDDPQQQAQRRKELLGKLEEVRLGNADLSKVPQDATDDIPKGACKALGIGGGVISSICVNEKLFGNNTPNSATETSANNKSIV